MKYLLLLAIAFIYQTIDAQEMESDLFMALNESALHDFHGSEKTRMTVSTYRHSKQHGTVEETTATYRKGKINANRVNFNIKYTEFYVVEDRKKSLGKYEFKDGQIFKYERTDFDNRNARMYTMYYNYLYTDDIVKRENIRTKEYVASGSVDMDTVVYRDTVIYEVAEAANGYRQDNITDPGVYSMYVVIEGKLKTKTNYFEGFNENITYTYDSKGKLVKILTVLTGEDGNTISTRTELSYSMDGLLTETKFYDNNDAVLERKVYAYK